LSNAEVSSSEADSDVPLEELIRKRSKSGTNATEKIEDGISTEEETAQDNDSDTNHSESLFSQNQNNWHGTVEALLKADLFELLQGLTNIGRSFSGLSKSETTSSTVFPFFKDFTLRRYGLNSHWLFFKNLKKRGSDHGFKKRKSAHLEDSSSSETEDKEKFLSLKKTRSLVLPKILDLQLETNFHYCLL
jgi:hypothetical protein